MRTVEGDDNNAQGRLGISDSEGPKDIANIHANEENEVLDKTRCLEALAELRHTKWFQV